MNPDNFQEAWQSQSSQGHLSVNAELLLSEVKRSQRLFTAIIFWRDVREVGISLILIPIWIYLGTRFSLPWTWYLSVPVLLWIAGFMLVDRVRNRSRSHEHESLRDRVGSSLREVEHQIWLLRNILWWYLLPVTFSVLAFVGQCILTQTHFDWVSALVATGTFAVVVIAMGFVYWINQLAVRSQLEPRRRELQTLLSGLTDESAQGDS